MWYVALEWHYRASRYLTLQYSHYFHFLNVKSLLYFNLSYLLTGVCTKGSYCYSVPIWCPLVCFSMPVSISTPSFVTGKDYFGAFTTTFAMTGCTSVRMLTTGELLNGLAWNVSLGSYTNGISIFKFFISFGKNNGRGWWHEEVPVFWHGFVK